MKQYYPIPNVSFRVGSRLSYVLDKVQGDIIEVGPLAGILMRVCQGVGTFEDHAAATVRMSIGQETGAIMRALDRLAAAGLFRPASELVRAFDAGARVPTRIAAVAIVTGGEWQLLRRCLESLFTQMRFWSSRPTVLIIDGSPYAADVEQNRERTSRLARAENRMLIHIGPSELAQIVERLATRSSLPVSVLMRYLSPASAGARKNIALLLTAGQDLILMDDRVMWSPWTLEEPSKGVVCGGHVEMREGRWFENRNEAFAAVRPCTLDPFSTYDLMLGRAVGELLTCLRPVDFKHACPHLLAGAVAGGDYVVRLTGIGMAGESDVRCPLRAALFASGATRHYLSSDESAFRIALRSRYMCRVASSLILTHDPAGPGDCVAICNRELTPPFMLCERDDKVLWAAIMSFLDPHAVFGHVPYGVLRDSDGASISAERVNVTSAEGSSLSDLFAWILPTVSRACFSQLPSERCERLVTCLRDLCALDVKEFARTLTQGILEVRCREIGCLEEELAHADAYPGYWVTAFEEYRRVFRVHVSRPAFYVPVELRNDSDSPLDGFHRTRIWLRECAALLDHWTRMWNTAREIAPILEQQ